MNADVDMVRRELERLSPDPTLAAYSVLCADADMLGHILTGDVTDLEQARELVAHMQTVRLATGTRAGVAA